MLWAAACMCFLGFLRMGEVVVPSTAAYDPDVHLSEGQQQIKTILYRGTDQSIKNRCISKRGHSLPRSDWE